MASWPLVTAVAEIASLSAVSELIVVKGDVAEGVGGGLEAGLCYAITG